MTRWMSASAWHCFVSHHAVIDVRCDERIAWNEPSGFIAPASSETTQPLVRPPEMKASASSSLRKLSNIRSHGPPLSPSGDESTVGSSAAKRSELACRNVASMAPGGTDSGTSSSMAQRFL